MIRLEGVRFAYPGGLDVVEADQLEIGPGLTLLLGPNGAGKSTLLRLMAGVERPREGRVSIGGHELWEDEVAARQPIAYVPEQAELTPYATIEEIVRLVCRLRRVSEDEATAAIERVGLVGHASRSIRQLSQGQRRRAVLAAAWVGQPSVLLLDEPLEAMDQAMRDEIIKWIRDSATEGRTAVVASHDFDDLVETASAALSVRAGSTTLHALPSEPAARAELLDSLARGS